MPEVAGGPGRYDGVSIIEHFNSRLADRDKAVDIAFTELQRRLDILNHAHEEMRKRDATFYSRELHDVYVSAVTEEFSRVRVEMKAEAKPKYLWVGALGAIFVSFGGMWYLSETISRLDTNQKIVMDELRKHDSAWPSLPPAKGAK